MARRGRLIVIPTRQRRLKWIAVAFGVIVGAIAYWPQELSVDSIKHMIYSIVNLLKFSAPDESLGREPWATIACFVCPTSTVLFLLTWFGNWTDCLVAQVRSWNRRITIGKWQIGRDSVAVYGTGMLAKQVSEGTRFLRAGTYFLKYAKYHIILMDSDEESIRFYREHRKKLEKRQVCIGLQQMESARMNSSPNVTYFNVFEEVARDYWKKYGIREELMTKKNYRIALVGYCRDNLGYPILEYGLRNNVFSTDQQITYNVFCSPEEKLLGFECLDTMNQDQVVWHTEQFWQSCPELLQSVDRIILCCPVTPETLNRLLKTCNGQQVDYYDPANAVYPQEYAYEYMRSFGSLKEILDEQTVLKNSLYQAAMERHYQHIRTHGSEKERQQILEAQAAGTEDKLRRMLWDDLSGFLKNSNVASSDYFESWPVEADMTPQELEERAQLEHIRWCRFHFLNGWKYGDTMTQERKDPKRRIHRSLCAWEDQSEEEHMKDRQHLLMEIRRTEDGQLTSV